MGTITKASYEALAAECAEWHKRAVAAEAALREIAKDSTPDPWGFARAALEIVAAPSAPKTTVTHDGSIAESELDRGGEHG